MTDKITRAKYQKPEAWWKRISVNMTVKRYMVWEHRKRVQGEEDKNVWVSKMEIKQKL